MTEQTENKVKFNFKLRSDADEEVIVNFFDIILINVSDIEEKDNGERWYTVKIVLIKHYCNITIDEASYKKFEEEYNNYLQYLLNHDSFYKDRAVAAMSTKNMQEIFAGYAENLEKQFENKLNVAQENFQKCLDQQAKLFERQIEAYNVRFNEQLEAVSTMASKLEKVNNLVSEFLVEEEKVQE